VLASTRRLVEVLSKDPDPKMQVGAGWLERGGGQQLGIMHAHYMTRSQCVVATVLPWATKTQKSQNIRSACCQRRQASKYPRQGCHFRHSLCGSVGMPHLIAVHHVLMPVVLLLHAAMTPIEPRPPPPLNSQGSQFLQFVSKMSRGELMFQDNKVERCERRVV
jgi:hypothetical protein